jgi:predicted nucleic acid-binding protein
VIVADTSALVSLATGDLLDLVLDEFDVRTTRTVVDELRETAAYDDPSGEGARKALDNRDRLRVREVDPVETGSDRIDEGEESCVALSQDVGAAFLVTDDLRALPELQPLVDARVVISPLVLKALVERDVLTAAEARNRLDEIANRRSWLGAPIYRRARDLFRE